MVTLKTDLLGLKPKASPFPKHWNMPTTTGPLPKWQKQWEEKTTMKRIYEGPNRIKTSSIHPQDLCEDDSEILGSVLSIPMKSTLITRRPMRGNIAFMCRKIFRDIRS